jgi:thioredoxin 1
MAALHITVDNFEKEVLQSDKPVLVDFWASWCGPCKVVLPIIEELAEEVTNAKVCKINVDEEPSLAQKFKIMTIPTLLVFKGGEVVNKSVGVVNKEQVLELLNV